MLYSFFEWKSSELNRKHTRYDKIKKIVCEKAAIYLNWPKTAIFQSFSNLPTKANVDAVVAIISFLCSW